MSGKNLTFKLIMNADTKGFDSGTKASKAKWEAFISTLKKESDDLKATSNEASKAVGNIIPSDLQKKADQAKEKLDELGSELQDVASTAKSTGQDIGNIIPKNASERANTLIKSLNETTEIIKSTGTGVIGASESFNKFGVDSVRSLNLLKANLATAKTKLEEFSKTKATPEDILKAQQQIDVLEKEVQQADQAFGAFKTELNLITPEIQKVNQGLNTTGTELSDVEELANRASGEIQGLKTGYTALTGAMAALGIGVTGKELAETADAFKSLEARISLSVGASGNLEQALKGVQKIAIETRSNLVATGELFSRVNTAVKDLGYTQEKALGITRLINQAMIVGGGSAASNEAAITQLNQAFQSGVLRGEEFNSMMEQSPRLSKALADGLGVNIGKLREMANTGQLTTNVVIKALQSQAKAVEAEFAKMPITIGQSIENLKTSWMLYIGELDKTHGISEKVAESIKYVADNLDQLVSTLTFAAQAFIAYKALGMAAVFLEKANSARIASLAIQQETVSLVANTQAQIANANAAKATAGAHSQIGSSIGSVLPTFTKMGTGLMGVVSRFGAYGLAATAVVAAGGMVKNMLVDTGEAIGENAAKFADWVIAKKNKTKTLSEVEKELAASEELLKKKQEEAVLAKEKNIARTEMLKNASLGLNEASKATVAEFDKLVKEGGKVAEVLGQIAKAFNFDTTTGINDGLTALLALQTQGKATGEEIRKALSGALTDEDLVKFQGRLAAIPINIEKQLEATNTKIKAKQLELDNWKKANSDINYKDWKVEVDRQRGDIEKLQAEASALHVQYANSVQGAAMVQGAILDEAIRRTGLSYEELQGKSTKAFEKASGDVNVVVNSMDELKSKGVDVGRALDASISNAIKTATTQQEIDALKVKIEGLRSDLGVKVADGLLQQASQQLLDIKDKVDQARAGINSTAEAFGVFGMQTPAQLKVVAEQYKQAFEEMKASGQATLDQQREAFKQYAEKAIAANKGVADSTILAHARMLDLKIEINDAGKAAISLEQATQRSVSQVYQPTVQNQPEVGMDKKASDDYWDNFKAEMKAKTDAANARAQTQRSSSRSVGGGSTFNNGSEIAQPIPSAPDAPMIASGFDITPLQDIQPTEKKILEIQSGNKSAELEGTPEAVDSMEEILREFEMLKKGM
ncbi:tape measure protein [Acinetobacter sp. WCHAc060007]|uniref:tape measure protein n=1 Tax=Acinetobacter sp. WCHAc060007 TaxID=2419605 RepID=UPI000EA065C0|nr:tape measure protein [Acinetobacter sp. WCHAc060007]RKG37353.1 tape measure domain-containing protein [Acinetobacter sp. WCHAc060007]